MFLPIHHAISHTLSVTLIPEGFMKNEISYELQRNNRFSQLKKELRAKLGTAFAEEGIVVPFTWNKGSVEGEIGHRS